MGNVSKKGKIWKVLLLAIFSSWFVLTELCLYIPNVFVQLWFICVHFFAYLEKMNSFQIQNSN